MSQPDGPDKREARAQAAAQKAYEKSQRSWFARHKILTGLGALFLVVAAVNATGGGAGSSTTATKASSGSSASAPAQGSTEDDTAADAGTSGSTAAAVGQAVRDGEFEFTVKKIEPGPSTIGSSDFGQKAQGRFLFVRVKVENIGDEPQSFFGDNQYLYVGERKYSADTEAAIYLEDSQSLFEEINPGNALDGIIVFDIPKGSEPTSLELHDSAFSGGVTIEL